jgi:hypothetical protein
VKRPARQPAFFVAAFCGEAFIPRSQNKDGGTANYQEHQAIPFVVGAGNANT